MSKKYNKSSNILDLFSMKNKVVAIFGGSGKLGQEFAKTLSQNGAKVYILDIKKKNFNFNNISFLRCDVKKNKDINNIFKKIIKKEKIFFPNKNLLNIEKKNSIKKYLDRIKPNYLIHAAALSRPMKIHEKKISQSINVNIVGTANIVKACHERNIKLIYFSSNQVYPCTKGNYLETDPVLPINNYALSKFGGECAVQMYPNSLILRICMTEKPFIHKEAFSNVKTSFIYHENTWRIP